MKATILLCGLLSWTAAVSAQDSPELVKLRESYKAAVAKATKPLTQTYLAELLRLRDTFTRSSNLAAANGVQAEIDIATMESVGMGAAKPAPAVAGAPSVKAGKAPDLRWFVGKSWATSRGHKWVFAKEGSAGEKIVGTTKTHSFTWLVLESGLVELTQKTIADGSSSKLYIRFKDRGEAWAGGDLEKQEAELHVE